MPAPTGKADYPGAADLAMFLAAERVPLTPEVDLTAAMETAILEFERLSERVMLTGPFDATRRLDVPVSREGRLVLDRDLAALTTVAFQPQGGTSNTLTQGQDYTLEPFNAAADGRPYEWIRFGPWGWSWTDPLGFWYRGALYITGKWGYATTLPANVWQAMIKGAAAALWMPLTVGMPGGPGGKQSEAQAMGAADGKSGGTSSATYQDLGRLAAAWQSTFEMTARRYRRITI